MATYKTPVEHFIKAVLKTQGLKSVPRIFVEKALALINLKLTNPCCTDNDASINYITRRRHFFTDSLEQLLNIIPKNGNVQSLKRARAILEQKLYCCEKPTFTAHIVEPDTEAWNAKVYTGRDVSEIDFENTITGSETITVKYYRGKYYVKFSLFSNSTPTPLTIANVYEYDGTTFINQNSSWTGIGTNTVYKTFTGTIPNIRIAHS